MGNLISKVQANDWAVSSFTSPRLVEYPNRSFIELLWVKARPMKVIDCGIYFTDKVAGKEYISTTTEGLPVTEANADSG